MNKKKVQVVVIARVDNEEYLLLLQTKMDRGEYWQNITGGLDKGEDYHQAAIRELYEETGIQSEVISTDLEFKFHDRWGKDVIEKVFHCLLRVNKLPQVTLCPKEHQDFKWVNISNVSEDNFGHRTNYEALLKVREDIK